MIFARAFNPVGADTDGPNPLWHGVKEMPVMTVTGREKLV